MKITIEPTNENLGRAPKVSLELPSDDTVVEDAIELVVGALVAYGYHPDSIKEYIPND